jgi:hypothetical protein
VRSAQRYIRYSILAFVFLCTLTAWFSGLLQAGQKPEVPEFHIDVRPWEEAQNLFRSDPCWLGGDGASSIDLGTRKSLWLFGDSFICTKGSPSRRDAVMVRNSVAVQSGRDPVKASMRFVWKTIDGIPASFFPEEGDDWFWPGSGALLNKRALIIFLVKVRTSNTELGFTPDGWKAVLVDAPLKDPGAWKLRDLACPATGDILVGSSSILIRDGFLYAFSTNWKDNSTYLLRWPFKDVSRGRLSRPQWWMGTAAGWMVAKPLNLKPVPVIKAAQVEFTVHYEPRIKGYLQVQTLSLADSCLAVRSSARLNGPWSDPTCIYKPPEKDSPGLLLYAGKAHKAFIGADLAFTYAVNATDKDRILDDMNIYYPKVLKGKITLKKARP